MKGAPLTVPEARAILVADEALDLSFGAREASGQVMGSAEGDAWRALVQSANDRIATYDGPRGTAPETLEVVSYPGGNEPDFQTLFCEAVAASCVELRKGYTAERLTEDDAAQIAELLRVSIDDMHWSAWHPKLRAIRDKMIARLGDVHEQRSTP